MHEYDGGTKVDDESKLEGGDARVDEESKLDFGASISDVPKQPSHPPPAHVFPIGAKLQKKSYQGKQVE